MIQVDNIKEKIRHEVFMKLGGDPLKLDWNQVNELTDKIIKLYEINYSSCKSCEQNKLMRWIDYEKGRKTD